MDPDSPSHAHYLKAVQKAEKEFIDFFNAGAATTQAPKNPRLTTICPCHDSEEWRAFIFKSIKALIIQAYILEGNLKFDNIDCA